MEKLQFITHHTSRYSHYHGALLALKGGCRWIQLRMKNTPTEEIEQVALQLKKSCKTYGATFIIDDEVELAKKIQADGVHLGEKDMPIAEARKLLGKDFIIGGTANTLPTIKLHIQAGADYVGLGPFRFTTTKQNLSPLLGIEGYDEIIEQLKKENLTIPIVAIGGITSTDIPSILATGIHGIALSGTILNHTNPIEKTAEILKIISETNSSCKNMRQSF